MIAHKIKSVVKKSNLMLAMAACLLMAGAADARQAILSHFTGTVETQAKGSAFWKKASPKMLLKEGEKVRTGKRSKATLLFEDGSRTEVYPDTTLSMSQLAAPVNLEQTSGRTRNKVKKGGRGFALRTPTAVCSVRGTEFDVGVGANGDTQLDVMEGVVNGLKTATGESLDVKAGESLNFDKTNQPLPAPGVTDNKEANQDSNLKAIAKKEVGLDMTREQIQAAAAEEMKLAEYQEGKSLIDINGKRVRVEEYILRRPRDVAEADRDKAFKFVVLNTRDGRFDFFTYKGVFNKSLPTDLSVALRNVSGRTIGGEPEYYLTSYEMSQSNLTDAIKDLADGGHLVKVTFDGTTYRLEAYSVGANGQAGAVTDTVLQNAVANGKTYDPVADVYKNTGASMDGIYDPANDTFKNMVQGDTLWRTVFNRYVHMMGPNGQLAGLTLDNAETAYRAGTLSQPYFQFYSNRDTAGAALTRTGVGNTAVVTNIATLDTYNNAGVTSDGTLVVRGKSLTLVRDQQIGDGSYKYLNGHYAFDSYFPDSADKNNPQMSDAIHQRLITYYPRTNSDIPYEQYDTYIFNDQGKIAPISAFANVTSGRAFKEELIKWNYQQITKSSAYGDRDIDLVAEPKILIRSGLIK